jgi:hypothetical protein
MRKYWFVRLTVLLILSALASAKIETANRPANSPVPDAVWQVLDPKGYHVVLDDGTVACDIWLRKSVPSSGKKDVEGALYPQLASSTLVGVISLSAGATDYRGEPVKAGFYTLRYELLPNDGNHLGVAPNRDFLLLIPAASDPDPNAQFKSDALVNLSRGATGTPHPGPLSLVQTGSPNPGVAKDDQDHWVFSGKLTLASGEELPFGLIVKGTAQQ